MLTTKQIFNANSRDRFIFFISFHPLALIVTSFKITLHVRRVLRRNRLDSVDPLYLERGI